MDADKLVLKGKCIPSNDSIRTDIKICIFTIYKKNDLNFHLKKLGKKEEKKVNPKQSEGRK